MENVPCDPCDIMKCRAWANSGEHLESIQKLSFSVIITILCQNEENKFLLSNWMLTLTQVLLFSEYSLIMYPVRSFITCSYWTCYREFGCPSPANYPTVFGKSSSVLNEDICIWEKNDGFPCCDTQIPRKWGWPKNVKQQWNWPGQSLRELHCGLGEEDTWCTRACVKQTH